MESPEPPARSIFESKEKHKRYEEIKNWAFIPERIVHLLPENYDPLLEGLQRRNWIRLAELLQMYDLDVVHEFYANAWAGENGVQQLQSKVQGRWVPFDKDSISAFLGDPLHLKGDEDCTYHRLKSQISDFNDDIVAREICLSHLLTNCSW
ncbi:hypothetical protein PHAVU_009G112900 [Phaseolus vulgaris]|uniref:Putative plant transposon protein domain-containing protein n=1 Tax=Phaseolus vulgaris TaxID=3885 RepID=V7AXC4_PHAVU|nr:hypothetical protein PHAVU_009G112900g [Phaseolus vulgaris]ESW09258.1 hypothetical protein PHAVU_009G112900g [Phaseolus vulgaris]